MTNKFWKDVIIGLIIVLPFWLWVGSQAFGAIYYVDDTCGTPGTGTSDTCSDAADDPFQTIAQAQAAVTGDQSDNSILFKKGGIWWEMFTIGAFGTAGHQFTVGAYGAGAKPIISASDLVETWADEGGNIWSATLTTEPEQVWFDGTNGTIAATYAALDADQEWYYCDACGDGADDTLYQFVGDDEDPDTKYIAPGTEASQRAANITAAGMDYITIDGLDLKHNTGGGGGAAIHCSGNCLSWTIQNNTIHDSDRGAIWLRTTSGSEQTGHLIQDNDIDNTCIDIGDCGGILLDFVDSSTIQRNNINNDGEHAIRIRNGDSNIIQYNILSNNGSSGLAITDSADPGVGKPANNIARYNIAYGNSHLDAGKSNMEMINTGGGNKYHNNLLYNSVTRGFRTSGADGDFFYNNTIYNSGTDGMYINTSQNLTIKNNIIDTVGDNHIEVDDNITGHDIDYNLYGDDIDTQFEWNDTPYNFADWKTNSSQDANSPAIADPLFTNAAGGDFTLQATSPCRNVGVDLGDTYDDALNPYACTWPNAVYTLDQDNFGDGWEIGAYVSAVPRMLISGNNVTLSYVLIDATAATYDVGLLITGASNTVENVTIDPGDGVAVLAQEDCTITNTIMSGSIQDIDILYGKTVTAVANNLEHSANDTTNIGDGTYTDTDSVHGTAPGFRNDGTDYHLTPVSGCISTGSNTGVDTDVDDRMVPAGAGYDIGAYEYYGYTWRRSIEAGVSGSILGGIN